MYTRCTHCDTVFRVTPQQLQASSGKVRCGRCHEVFDAFSSLSAQLPAAAAAEIEVQDRLEPAAGPEQPQQRPCLLPGGGVVTRCRAGSDLPRRESGGALGEGDVTRVEEGPDRPGVRHAYSNFGSRLARKAS